MTHIATLAQTSGRLAAAFTAYAATITFILSSFAFA